MTQIGDKSEERFRSNTRGQNSSRASCQILYMSWKLIRRLNIEKSFQRGPHPQLCVLLNSLIHTCDLRPGLATQARLDLKRMNIEIV